MSEIRAGDHIHHKPSGEDWVVACTNEKGDELICCGWPESLTETSHCTLVEACDDDEHRRTLEACAKLGGLRGSWARRQLDELMPCELRRSERS